MSRKCFNKECKKEVDDFKRANAKYCSIKCKDEVGTERRREDRWGNKVENICLYCGRSFFVRGSKQLYCGPICRTRFNNEAYEAKTLRAKKGIKELHKKRSDLFPLYSDESERKAYVEILKLSLTYATEECLEFLGYKTLRASSTNKN